MVQPRLRPGLLTGPVRRNNKPSLCHPAHISIHTGQNLRWDPDDEKFLDNDAANEYLDKPIHAPLKA